MTFRKHALAIMLGLMVLASPCLAAVAKQGGMEFYTGSNHMNLFTVWVGLRKQIVPSASCVVKYYNHHIQYDHEESGGAGTRTRRANVSNLTGVVFYQKGPYSAYGALSVLKGTDAYDAVAFDAGVSRRLWTPLEVELGMYGIREDSVLWYPNEASRTISLWSVKGGAKIKLNAWATLTPYLYKYRNSDDVDAFTYSLGVEFHVKRDTFITLSYFNYSESGLYRFSGNYFSGGISTYH